MDKGLPGWRIPKPLTITLKQSNQINTNKGDLPADMFLLSHWESQTRHQVASSTYRTMHTGGDSYLAWTLRRWATKPNMKKKS